MPLRLALMIEGQEGLTWERWRRIARTAEQGGFESLFRSDHLTGLFGDPDTTDNLDGSWDHEFASGGDDLPSYTIEVGMPKVPAFFRHSGVKLNSVALEFTRSGPAAATGSAGARPASSSRTATPCRCRRPATRRRDCRFAGPAGTPMRAARRRQRSGKHKCAVS